MRQPELLRQPSEKRIHNILEVSAGLSKIQSLEESRRCPQCADPVCTRGCPLGIDIPGFIRLMREKDNTLALKRIQEANPFPAICGRVCRAPCETACIYHKENAPISIRALERFAADNGRRLAERPSKGAPGKKIAIVGSGPAGLTAAAILIRRGFTPVIFETDPEPGGVLRYGIPEFRLPKKILAREIAELTAAGVKIRTNVMVGLNLPFKDIFTEGFAAILLAAGRSQVSAIKIPGAHLGGVYVAQEMLKRIYLRKEDPFPKSHLPLVLGNKAAVIGAGYGALDLCRWLVRLNREVKLLVAGLEEEMPVHKDDLAFAKEEGVQVESLTRALEILGNAGQKSVGVKCRRLDFRAQGEGNNWHLEEVAGSEFVVEADTVIVETSCAPHVWWKQHASEWRWNADGTLWTDPATGMTSQDKVFAAGEITSGAGYLVDAMANGKRAARKIEEYLLK